MTSIPPPFSVSPHTPDLPFLQKTAPSFCALPGGPKGTVRKGLCGCGLGYLFFLGGCTPAVATRATMPSVGSAQNPGRRAVRRANLAEAARNGPHTAVRCAQKSGTVPVVLSLALYGDRQAQLCTLTNVLGKTVAPLVVHFSFVGGQRMAAEARAVLLGSCRGHENPQPNRVSRLAPGILLAHLSNFEHGVKVLTTAADTRFVFLASNMVILRPGLEEWVSRHSLSFCVHSICTDWPCTAEELLGGVCARRLEERQAWPAWPAWPDAPRGKPTT